MVFAIAPCFIEQKAGGAERSLGQALDRCIDLVRSPESVEKFNLAQCQITQPLQFICKNCQRWMVWRNEYGGAWRLLCTKCLCDMKAGVPWQMLHANMDIMFSTGRQKRLLQEAEDVIQYVMEQTGKERHEVILQTRRNSVRQKDN